FPVPGPVAAQPDRDRCAGREERVEEEEEQVTDGRERGVPAEADLLDEPDELADRGAARAEREEDPRDPAARSVTPRRVPARGGRGKRRGEERGGTEDGARRAARRQDGVRHAKRAEHGQRPEAWRPRGRMSYRRLCHGGTRVVLRPCCNTHRGRTAEVSHRARSVTPVMGGTRASYRCLHAESRSGVTPAKVRGGASR